jgi:Polyketide cyclase / dehydrase and lipid transport
LSPRRSRPIGAAISLPLLLPLALASQPGWVAEHGIQSRLAAGEVVVQTASEIDPAGPQGRARAAVRINASPQAIWSVMTDCNEAVAFVPGLKRCRRIDGAPDGRWEDIEHEVRYSALLPAVRYVFRADYDRPRRIDFHRISGDLKAQEGTWLLTRTADGTGTVVEYDVYLDPGFWVPQFLVTRSLRKDLPAALSGLRDRVEHRKAPR